MPFFVLEQDKHSIVADLEEGTIVRLYLFKGVSLSEVDEVGNVTLP